MSNSYGGDRAIEEFLSSGVENGDHDEVDQPKAWSVNLSDDVTNCGGPCIVTQLDETWRLEVDLGPRNMRKVIEFLRNLPPEPDEDGDGFMCGVIQGTSTSLASYEVTKTFSVGWWAWVERSSKSTVLPRLEAPGPIFVLFREEHVTIDGYDLFIDRTGPFDSEGAAALWLNKRNNRT